MWPFIGAIAWAQWRITRNHLPRTGMGTWLMAALGVIWYCGFAAISWGILRIFSMAEPSLLQKWLPAGLLGVCAFWQIVPLVTLTGGWSLNLKKLQSFPVPAGALFGVEALLRATTAFEMLLVVAGAFLGLLKNPAIPKQGALFLLLIVPFNLLLSLGLREFILHSFARNRLREIFALAAIGLGLIPQLAVHTSLGGRATPYALGMSRWRGLPWSELGRLSSGRFSLSSIAAMAAWIAASYVFARWMFGKGMREEEGVRAALPAAARKRRTRNLWEAIVDIPGRIWADPLAILVQKEIRALVRMPRFRVMFGMACLFSVVIFFPLSRGDASLMRSSFPQVVPLYGMLILSDALFWNIFGFDRGAAQIYFAAPVELRRVIQAKNLTAVLFVGVQNAVVLLLGILLRFVTTPLSVAAGLCATAVVMIFFLAAGNISSMTTPRSVDPAQTLRRQTTGQRQLWLLGCSAGMFALVGLGLLARWALGSDWALIGVLAVEFGIGTIVFRIAMDSAVQKGATRREEIIEALSKGGAQIAL